MEFFSTVTADQVRELKLKISNDRSSLDEHQLEYSNAAGMLRMGGRCRGIIM